MAHAEEEATLAAEGLLLRPSRLGRSTHEKRFGLWSDNGLLFYHHTNIPRVSWSSCCLGRAAVYALGMNLAYVVTYWVLLGFPSVYPSRTPHPFPLSNQQSSPF
jgi:hypothetical protein